MHRQADGSLRVIRTLVLDPGHGGGNEGARSAADHLEKEEVLRVAYAVRARLKKTWPDLNVVLTRSLDVDVDLVDRIRAANTIEADLFLSIHMNSSVNTNAHGYEVFYLRADKSMPLVTSGKGTWGKHYHEENSPKEPSPAPSYGASGEALAILFSDLDQGRAHRDSALLAETLLDEMRTSFPNRKSRGVRQANFGVLRGSTVPAVVVELGFLSHKEEERWLRKPVTHRQFAEAVVRTVRRLDTSFQKQKYHETARLD